MSYLINAKTIQELIEKRAAHKESSLFAFFSNEKPVTVSELNQLSNNIAVQLEEKGIIHASRVILISKPGAIQLAMIMACWKLGAIISPVDRFISEKELCRLIKIFHPTLTFIEPGIHGIDELSKASLNAGCLTIKPLIGKNSPASYDIKNSLSHEDLAICMFTSGSTGLPKGVVLTHEHLLLGAKNVICAKKITNKDRALCVLPLSHMNGLVTTFIAPLMSMGSVVYMQTPFSALEAVNHIDKYECTWFSATPMHYSLMTSPPVEKKDWSLRTLRFCRSASAPLPDRVLQEFEAHYGVPIIETMGTTETAGQIFSNPLPPFLTKVSSIGFPVNYDVRLVDNNGKCCNDNEKGEIQVKGNAIMLEYLDDPEETAKAFDKEWFKTGDIAIRDKEGYYFIKGRKKDIVIFCGLNISLRDLEMTIHNENLVLDVACKGENHPVWGETIAVYAIPKNEDTDLLHISNLIYNTLESKLPDIQALKDVYFVSKFYRSNTGKILKERLKELEVKFHFKQNLSKDPRTLLSNILNIPLDLINNNLRLGSTPEWDSLKYIAIMAAVETLLNRKLNKYEIEALISFKGLETLLTGKFVQKSNRYDSRKTEKDIVSMFKDAGYGENNVNYVMIGFEYCIEKGVRNAESFLETLLDELPEGKNIIMNSFTWKFCQGEPYHFLYSSCEVGLLNEIFHRRKDTIRGNHPIYSYCAYGPEALELVHHECDTCWGKNSVTYQLLMRNDVRTFTYGLPPLRGSLLRANPAMHTLEEMNQVSYRFFKEFRGYVNFGKAYKEYTTKMYVRHLNSPVDSSWVPLDNILRNKKNVIYDVDEKFISYMNNDVFIIGNELISNDLNVFKINT